MYQSKKKSNSRRLSKALIAGLVVLAVGLAYGGYRLYQNHNKPTTLKTPDGGQASLAPATESDKQASEDHKDAIVKQNAQTNTPNSGTSKTSSVVITNKSTTGVRAYVTGVFEEGGVCTALAVQGPKTSSATSSGFENVSTTQCAPLDWDTPLSTGSWTITVSYKSASTESKQTVTLEVN